LSNAKVKLNELYDRVLDNLQNTNPEIISLAFDALDIKVNASDTGNVEIQGVIPLELPVTALTTTARTSGRTEHHRKLNLLISAEIHEHKLAGHTLLLL
jgi:hypothetical protein